MLATSCGITRTQCSRGLKVVGRELAAAFTICSALMAADAASRFGSFGWPLKGRTDYRITPWPAFVNRRLAISTKCPPARTRSGTRLTRPALMSPAKHRRVKSLRPQHRLRAAARRGIGQHFQRTDGCGKPASFARPWSALIANTLHAGSRSSRVRSRMSPARSRHWQETGHVAARVIFYRT
jgi:hypothetical protein